MQIKWFVLCGRWPPVIWKLFMYLPVSAARSHCWLAYCLLSILILSSFSHIPLWTQLSVSDTDTFDFWLLNKESDISLCFIPLFRITLNLISILQNISCPIHFANTVSFLCNSSQSLIKKKMGTQLRTNSTYCFIPT